MMIPKNTFHFSIDDVFDSLIEISDKNINPQEHPFFDFLIELHNSFNINIDLYLFYQKKINGRKRILKEVSSDIRIWFGKNPWLKLGPHALEDRFAPYQQTISEQVKTFNAIYKEIERFSGNLSKFVRLHYFSESFELSDYFRKLAVKAIFTTDKEAITYRMPNEIKEELAEHSLSSFNGISFIRSHLRSENLANEKLEIIGIKNIVNKFINKFGFLIFFTHEYELERVDVQKATVYILNTLIKNGSKSM